MKNLIKEKLRKVLLEDQHYNEKTDKVKVSEMADNNVKYNINTAFKGIYEEIEYVGKNSKGYSVFTLKNTIDISHITSEDMNKNIELLNRVGITNSGEWKMVYYLDGNSDNKLRVDLIVKNEYLHYTQISILQSWFNGMIYSYEDY